MIHTLKTVRRNAVRLRGLALAILCLFALSGIAEADQQVAYGSYVGNSSGVRHIGDVGFQPDFVLVKSEGADPPVIRIDSMPFGMSKPVGVAESLGYFMIGSFDADGFWISSSSRVNQSGTTYQWVAIRADDSILTTGDYRGNGNDNRDITGLGFRPTVVMVFPARPEDGSFRISNMPFGQSARFRNNDLEGDSIQDLESDGFEVGRNNRVNEDNRDFYYIAWASNTFEIDGGYYRGDGQDDRSFPVEFDPLFVLVKPDENSPAIFRSDPSLGDVCFPFAWYAPFSGGIQALGTKSFEVGADSRVNQNNSDFYWLAWGNTSSSSADIAVDITADPSTVVVGDSIYVNASVWNAGSSDAQVGAVIGLPVGTTLERSSTTAGVFSPSTGKWNFETLAVGDTAHAALVFTADEGEAWTTKSFSAGVLTSTEPDPDTSNDNASVDVDVVPPLEADILVEKEVDFAEVDEGDIFTYTVTATNLGPRDVSDLRIGDVLPAGLTLDDVDEDQGSYADGEWDVGSLAVGERVGLVLDVEADAGTAGTTITNVAALASSDVPDPNADNDSASVDVRVLGADLSIDHAVDPEEALPGGTVTYTTTLSNAGPDKAGAVVVQLDFPGSISEDMVSPSSGSYDSDTETWTLVEVGIAASETLTWKGIISESISGDSVTSTAEIISATPVDPNPGDEQDSAILYLGRNALGVTKTVDDANPVVGGTIRYTVVVENTGTRAATGVSVEDALPAEVDYLSHSILQLVETGPLTSTYDPVGGVWDVGDLDPGEFLRLLVDVEVRSGTEGATFTNTATITAPNLDGDDPADNEASVDVTVQGADISVSHSQNSVVLETGVATEFTITVRNDGPDRATGVLVEIDIPSSLGASGSPDYGSFDLGSGFWTVGDLDADTTQDLVLTLTPPDGAAGRDVELTSLVSAAQPSDPDSDDHAASTSFHILGADLSVTQTVSDPVVMPGNSVDFVITLRNLGPDDASSIIIRDQLPSGLDYESHSATAGAYNPGNGRWTLSALASGDLEQLTLTATVTTTNTVVNQATRISSTPTDPESRNDSDSEEVGTVVADLRIEVEVDDSILYEGTETEFTVEVTNLGPNEATDIVIEELFPPGLELTGSSATSGSYDPDFALWSVPTLEDGASATLTLEVEVPLGSSGDWAHAASLFSSGEVDPVSSNDEDSIAIEVRAEVDVSVGLSASPSTVREGETVTLTVFLENDGPSPATSTTIHLDSAAALVWSSHSATQGTYDPIAGAWSVGTLAVGEDASLEVEVVADVGSAGSVAPVEASLQSLVQDDTNSSNDSDQLDVTIASGLLVTAGQAPAPLLPGSEPTPLLSIELTNASGFDETLQFVEIALRTTGSGESADLLAQWQSLELWTGGILVATADPADVVRFSDIGVSIGSGSHTLEVRSGATLSAKDGDLLDLLVESGSSLGFGRDVTLTATWPLDPAGSFPIDGHVAAQITAHSLPSGSLSAGGDPVLAADFTIPGNGYDDDVLESLALAWSGTAAATDLIELSLWRDGGDGVFGGALAAGDDESLGVASHTDGVWTVTGLEETVPAAGLRFFCQAIAHEDAVPGRSFALRLGLGALVMSSANDGPIDLEVPVSGTFLLNGSDDPVVTVDAIARSPQPLLPGAPTLQMLRIRVQNAGPGPVTLQSLTVEDGSEVEGTPEQADASWSMLELAVSDALSDHDESVHATLTGGEAVFSGLDLIVEEGSSADLTVLGAASIRARDGDALQLRLGGPGSLVWDLPVSMDASWPLVSADPTPVDGMSVAQLALDPLEGRHVPAGSEGIVVAAFTVPPNGYAEDVLETLSLVNLGDATSTDVARLELFVGDESAGDATPSDGRWVWTGLDLAVPVDGLALVVEADIDSSAVPGRTLRIGIPGMPEPGLTLSSENDGPRDASAAHLASFEIAPREGAIAVSVSGEIGVSLLPGDVAQELLRVRLSNETVETETLEHLAFDLVSSGLGESAQIEAGWGGFELWLESSTGGDPTSDPAEEGSGEGGLGNGSDVTDPVLLATASVGGDAVTFSDLTLYLDSGSSFELSFRGGASLLARDGDRMDPRLIVDELGWTRELEVVALGALDPPGNIVVDGMSAAQIELFPVETVTFEAGSVRNLTLDLVVPANGYLPDRLERLNLRLEGSAGASDVSALELWRDDGDGEFVPGLDDRLGSLRLTGDRWEITGLDVEVPVPGQRLFVSADISEAALESRSFELLLPAGDDVALGMTSGNDGPRDVEIGDGRQHVISSVDRVALAARTIPSGTVYPGQENVPLLHLFATNTYPEDRTVEGLTVHSRAEGLGTTAELDLAFDVLLLYEDADGDGRFNRSRDRVLAADAFESGATSFANLSWTLPASGSGSLFLIGQVSDRWAHDGDELAVEVSDPLDLVFSEGATSVTGTWPLSSGSSWVVDGMVAAQIETSSGGTRSVGPGQGPVLAFEFTLPANGYLVDQLESLVFENLGTAGEEIGRLELWNDGGDGVFSEGAGDDVSLGVFVPSGGRWFLESLDHPLGLDENRFFAGVTAADQLVDSVAVVLQIPREGVQVSSGNDGPYDLAAVSPVSLLLSNAPLVANVATSPRTTNIDQIFEVSLVVENRTEEGIESVIPTGVSFAGDGVITVISGPSPESFDLGPGETGEFIWQVRGTEPGTVEVLAKAEGRADSDGSILESLQARSAPHELRIGAEGLNLFALGSLPVTLSYGQTGVVPLSLTFRNPGEAVGSDIELTGVRIRLEDEDGDPVVPGGLLGRVVVNEGNRIYYSSTSLPSEGDVVDLVFGSPVVITTSEPTTLNLRFDLLDVSPYESYRVIVDDATGFSARDATSGAAVGVDMVEGVFPLVSGLARLVSEATAVEVRPLGADDLRVGPGSANLEALMFEATAGGGSGAGADSRVGSFAIRVTDESGDPLPALGDWIDRLQVRTPLQTLVTTSVGAATSGDSLVLRLSSPLTLPANTPVPITITADLRPDIPATVLRFELEDPGSIDARDANTGGAVPVIYENSPIVGPTVRIESPATELWVSGTAELPDQASVGVQDLSALRLVFTHPGTGATSRGRIESLTLQLWNDERSGLVPGDYLSQVEVWEGDVLVGATPTVPETGTTVGVSLDGITLEPGESRSFEVRIDLESTAPTGWLELTAGAAQIVATEVNAGGALEILPAPGSDLPLFSGLTRVTAPAREISVELVSLVPAALVRDDLEVSVAELVLGHPDTDGTGPIQVEDLVLRGAGGNLEPLVLGETVTAVRAYLGEEVWASATLDGSSLLATLEGNRLELGSGEELRLELRAVFSKAGTVSGIRFGVEQEDIGVVQPEGALFEIEPRAKSGAAFPLWTELGSFGPVDVEESYVNFPNPFAAGREETTFVYYLPESGTVDLRIWTLRGDEVVTLLSSAAASAGLHQEVVWDGRNGDGTAVRNGVYLAELEVHVSGRSERYLRKVAVVR